MIYTINKTLLILMFLVSCNRTIDIVQEKQQYEKQDESLNRNETSNDNEVIIRSIKKDFWELVTPIALMDTLQKGYLNRVIFMIEENPDKNWFNQKYIIPLKNYLGDTSACTYMFSKSYNFLPQRIKSTLGHQVKFLLENYGEFPSNFFSAK